MIARIPSRSLKTGLAVAALAFALAGCSSGKWGFRTRRASSKVTGSPRNKWPCCSPACPRAGALRAGQPHADQRAARRPLGLPVLLQARLRRRPGAQVHGLVRERPAGALEGDKQPELQPYQINTPSAQGDEKAEKRLNEDEARLKEEQDAKKRDSAAPVDPRHPIPRPAGQRARAAALTPRNSHMRIVIAGASGRMGQMLIEAVLAADGLELAVALDRKDSASLGQDAGAPLGKQTGVAITDNLDALSGADCLIDFTRPEGHAGASAGLRAPWRESRHRHHRLRRGRPRRHRGRRPEDRHRLAQHERGRERHARCWTWPPAS